ncbi:C39 family peptidase [Levilactobacillus enshiensis]|uniref:C39 family peptidase n=1 Tax=Levilactobacillus enshiensis TaxID=2590213 RepID=UPI00117A0BEF|nr:C39 family peptidase [Levilactobacillus enshiensis]
MKRFIGSLALILGLMGGGALNAQAAKTTVSSASATSTSSSATASTTRERSRESSTKPATPDYRAVLRTTKVNYYTKIGLNLTHNYKVYKTGGAKSSAKNMTPIATGRQYANLKVHVTREQKMADGTWLKFTYNHTRTGWIHHNGTVKSYRYLNVPLIAQRPQLPTGCEITATAMMLKYAGANVTKMTLAKEMPRSSNPNKGFVGSPYAESGWWIYPKGLLGVVRNHVGTAKDMTGASFATLKKQINQGHPVVIWVAGVDGFVNHAITMSGYSRTRVYYNDPWTKKKTSMTQVSLNTHRSHDGYRALSY